MQNQLSEHTLQDRAENNYCSRVSMIGEKRSSRPAEDLPNCVTGQAPSHFNPSKKQATGRENFRVASNIETDAHRLESRLKQCQYGKNTIGYDNYVSTVPKHKRRSDVDEHPRTPDPYEIQSKRAFDGRIKVWRRALHIWDSKVPEKTILPNAQRNANPSNKDIDNAHVDKSLGGNNKSIDQSKNTVHDSVVLAERNLNIDSRNGVQSNFGQISIIMEKSNSSEPLIPQNLSYASMVDPIGIETKYQLVTGDHNDNTCNVDRSRHESALKLEAIPSSSTRVNNDRHSNQNSDRDLKELCKSSIEDKRAENGWRQAEFMDVVIKDEGTAIHRSSTSQIGFFAQVKGEIPKLIKTENSTHREEEIIESKFFIDRSPPRLKRAGEDVGMPSPDESDLHNRTHDVGSLFHDTDGPQIIMNEDSMQSVDYEKSMLDQNFNTDTAVDVLGTLDEDDDEDVL